MNFNSFLDPNYIFSTATGTTYESWYLYLSYVLIATALMIFVGFRIKKRIKAYRTFDKYLIWGCLVLGLLGFVVWFSRNQGLPTFSMRFFSYVWIASILGYSAFLFYYFKKKIPSKIEKHYENKRKEKYLK